MSDAIDKFIEFLPLDKEDREIISILSKDDNYEKKLAKLISLLEG